MRTMIMIRAFLFLLCATSVLAAACEHLAADGVAVNTNFNPAKTVVTCTDTSYELFLDGKQVDGNEAECTYNEGWIGTMTRKTLIQTVVPLPTLPPSFECRKAPPCLFQQVDGLHFEDNKLECRSGNNSLLAIEFNSMKYTMLTCERWPAIWTAPGDAKKVADTATKLAVTCVEYCASSGTGIKVDIIDNIYLRVSCIHSNHELFYNGKKLQDGATCSLHEGWSTNDVHETDSKIFECRKVPLTPCSIATVSGIAGNKFDPMSKILTCESYNTTLGAISFNLPEKRPLILSLTCDENEGWKAGGEKIAEADTYLADMVSCVEYCAVSENYEIKVNIFGDTAQVSCIPPNHELLSSRKNMHFGPEATCTLNGGWKTGKRTMPFDAQTFPNLMYFECEFVTPTSTAIAPSRTTTRTSKLPAGITTTTTLPASKPNIEPHYEDENKEPSKQAEAQNLPLIIGGSIGALAIIAIIVAIIIFKLVSARKRRPAENKSNMSGKSKSMKTKSETTKTDMSGKTKSKATKSENTNTDKSGKTKSEKSKSEKSKTDQTKSEKTKSEMSETKSEKTKSKMNGSMKNTMSGRKSEISGTGNRSSER